MPKTKQLAFRLPADLIDRLDAHAKRLNAQTPGLDLTRTGALRVLLTRALDDAEREAKARRDR